MPFAAQRADNGSGSAPACITFGRALGYVNNARLDIHGAGA